MICALTVVRDIAGWLMTDRPGGHPGTKPWADLPEHLCPRKITYLGTAIVVMQPPYGGL